MNPTPGKYVVMIDDNYHCHDESARHGGGSFATLADAVRDCQQIVDRSLEECYIPGMSAAELLGRYKMFGEDSFIQCEEPSSVQFSAWEYAEQRCEEICSDSNG